VNLTYKGSVAEENMNFASSVDVVENENNELFNAVSLYVPLSLAANNIVDFDPDWVTRDIPAVMTCTVENYAKIMKGPMLSQWTAAFRQDTNTALVVYLIVFLDDATTTNDWEIDESSIVFKPLSNAFEKLFFISYIKMMFDEDYDGSPHVTGTTAGTAASAEIEIENVTGSDIVIPSGMYTHNDGVKDWSISIVDDLTVGANASSSMTIAATTVGSSAALVPGAIDLDDIVPTFPAGLTVTVVSVEQGSDPTPIEEPSTFFDRSLALALLCKGNVQLSHHWSLVRLHLANNGFPAVQGVADPNQCWIRSKTAAEEKAFFANGVNVGGTQQVPAPRSQHYWGCLWQMGCLLNTWVVVHSEPLNILTEALGAWFAQRNASGQYIGNKLSMLRLTGANIKPFGYPSLLSSDVNENDAGGHAILNEKNVGYLKTISDSSAQQSVLTSALSLSGMPVTARMIASFVSYTAANQCSDMITASGTLVDPTLTDAAAYGKIQGIVQRLLERFSSTNGRIYGVVFNFPSFEEAKVGRTEFEAAQSWTAKYKDDLTKVTVTGGITAE
jgi:hypothetical protein